ncbi:MAG: hypothetical protein OES46_01280 [Gammaproteobacteria bacterium]|jgi:hypothetical protein|nr:hypothetical protein [Gammaproteobacteria bacterium]
MQNRHSLDSFETESTQLAREWLVKIQTPIDGVDPVIDALNEKISLKQGAYDKCLYITAPGYQRFHALEGSHAGLEDTMQNTSAVEITFSIPPNSEILDKVFDTVFAVHCNEEPTIHIQEIWGSRSKYIDDKDNPNRYWNRADAEKIHGSSTALD